MGMTPEARARWKASIKANPNNDKPAGGMGWGGPPRGSGGNGSKRDAATARANKRAIDPALSVAKKDARKTKREKLLGHLEKIALDPKTPAMVRVHAIDKYFDRTEGKPLQGNVNYDGAQKSLSELIADTQRLKDAKQPE